MKITQVKFKKIFSSLLLVIIIISSSSFTLAKTSAETKTSEQLISLDFQNINTRDLLRLIAKISGKNIVISDLVNGKININLQNVTWQEALEVVLNMQGLSKHENNSVIYVAPTDKIEKNFVQHLNNSSAINLRYAQANDIASLLSKQSGLLPENTNIIANQHNNGIIINAKSEQIAKIQQLINSLDVPTKQVSIEGYIITVNDDVSRELGLKFSTTTSNSGDSSGMNMDLPFGVADPGHFGFALAKLGEGSILNMELSALESEGHAKIISNPKLLATNNQPAFIEAGEEIPYQEKTSSGATNTAFKKAVLSLKVTPEILSKNHIILHLQLNQDKVSDLAVNGVPAIQTQQMQTQVSITNGDTIVLGGIYEQSKIENITKTPLLSSIPLLGKLFTNKQTEISRKELMIFVTTKVVD